MDTRHNPGSREELVIARTFDAPRERVWEAWTDPDLLACWWGPQGFTAPIFHTDVRVGGRYFYCMRSPDGEDTCATGTYREVRAPERLVATDSFADEEGNVVSGEYYGMNPDFPRELTFTVTLEEHGDRTRMTLMHAGMPPGQDRELVREGWSQSFDKLELALDNCDTTTTAG